MLIWLAVGLVKLWIGIQCYKPLGFLILIIATIIVFSVILFANTQISQFGKSVLDRYKLRYTRSSRDASAADVFLPMAYALLGASVLENTSYADFGNVIRKIDAPSGGGGDGGGGGGGG